MKSVLSVSIMFACLMTLAAAPVHAENTEPGTTHPNPGKLQLLQMIDDLPAGDYQKTHHTEKRDMRSPLRFHSKSTAESMGLSKKSGQLAAEATNVTTSPLTRQDVTFNLNGKESVAFEIRDPTDKNRVVLLSYRMKW